MSGVLGSSQSVPKQSKDDRKRSKHSPVSKVLQNAIFFSVIKNNLKEISPVTISTKKGEIVVSKDEEPAKFIPGKIAKLRPPFAQDGTKQQPMQVVSVMVPLLLCYLHWRLQKKSISNLSLV